MLRPLPRLLMPRLSGHTCMCTARLTHLTCAGRQDMRPIRESGLPHVSTAVSTPLAGEGGDEVAAALPSGVEGMLSTAHARSSRTWRVQPNDAVQRGSGQSRHVRVECNAAHTVLCASVLVHKGA